MEDRESVAELAETEVGVASQPKRKISRRLVLKTGLAVAGATVIDSLLPKVAVAQSGELKPLPGISPANPPKAGERGLPNSTTIIRIDSDGKDLVEREEGLKFPESAQSELEKLDGVVRNFLPKKFDNTELYINTKLSFKKGEPIASHAIVHANINTSTQLVNYVTPEIDIYVTDTDPTSVEYAKLVGGMGYGKILNMANNQEAVEQFESHVKRSAGIDLLAKDKRLDEIAWLFDFSHYVKGSAKEYSVVISSETEQLFMRCFSLLHFKKSEVLANLRKSVFDNEQTVANKKRGANIFLSTIETMMDLRKGTATTDDLKLTNLIKELEIMSGRKAGIA